MQLASHLHAGCSAGAAQRQQLTRRQATPEAATAAIQPMRVLTSVTELLGDDCQGLLLDQFGVLHDGKQAYPGAVNAVRELAQAGGARIVILSNSSRRSDGTLGKLARMGFDEQWFAGAITSGELTHRFLEARPDAWWQQLGRRCIHITWSSRGTISLAGLGLEVVEPSQLGPWGCTRIAALPATVERPADADFILAHGTEALGLPGGGTRDVGLEALHALLQQCAAEAARTGRALPLICANPDIVTVDGPRSLITMPGTLAAAYAALGGQVRLMGKPASIIYSAVNEMHPGLTWLAIGDSLEHDIAGAQRAGIKSLFIVGGIHAADVRLQGAPDLPNAHSTWDAGALQQLCEAHGVAPDYCMAHLQA